MSMRKRAGAPSALVKWGLPMRSVCAVGFAALLATAACGGAGASRDESVPTPSVPPMVSDKLLMQGIIDPAAMVIWDATGETLVDVGSQPGAGKDDVWAAVRRSAITLAEAGNLLQLEGRPRDGDVWIETAKALADAGAAALAAADAKDVAKLSEAGDRIYLACENCHKKHLLTGAGSASPEGPGTEKK